MVDVGGWERSAALRPSVEVILERISSSLNQRHQSQAKRPFREKALHVPPCIATKSYSSDGNEEVRRCVLRLNRVCDLLRNYSEIVNNSLEVMDVVSSVREEAGRGSDGLSERAVSVVRETEQMSRISAGLSARLAPFRSVIEEVHYVTKTVEDEEKSVTVIEESMNFLANNMHFLDSKKYLMLGKKKREKLYMNVRDRCISIIQKLATTVIPAELPARVPSSLLPLLQILARRREAETFLNSVFSVFTSARTAVVFPTLSTSLNAIVASHSSLPDAIRRTSSLTISTASDECSAAASLFPFPSLSQNSLSSFVRAITRPLAAVLRPLVIKETNVSILCDAVDVLLNEAVPHASRSCGQVEKVFNAVLFEIQERLIFRADVFIRDFGSLVSDIDPRGAIEQAVTFLSKMFRSVDTHVFERIAHETVTSCASLFVRYVSSSELSGTDAKLFLIGILLVLRSRIRPFRCRFAVSDAGLDFSHLVSVFADLLRGRRSLAVFTRGLLKDELRISVHESDSRIHIEKEVNRLCEEVIMSSTNNILEPLLSHMGRATALANARKTTSVDLNPFLMSEKVKDVMETVNKKGIDEKFALYVMKLKRYVEDENTKVALLNSVKGHIVSAYDEFHKLLERHGVNEEERIELGVLSLENVNTILDSSTNESEEK